MTGQSLFRQEVLTSRQAQWLGSIRIGRPPSFAWVSGIALALALALIAFALLGQVTRKTTVPGLLVPSAGLLQLTAPQAGVVAEILVEEGAQVQPGQALMRLKTEHMTAGGEVSILNAQALSQRKASLELERRLTVQQARQRQDALNDRLISLEAEARQALAELETHQVRSRLAATSEARFVQLAQSGFVSEVQLQQKQEEHLDLQLRERTAQRAVEALQRDIHAARAELASNDTALKTSLSQMDRALAQLAQEVTENSARTGLTVTASRAARVTALTLHPGQVVQSGQTLISLMPLTPEIAGAAPDETLEAQLFASSRTAGFVQPGQSVRLRYAAYPYQKFGMAEGRVSQISQTPIAAQDLPAGQAQALLTAAQTNEPLYRITVRLQRQTIDTYGQTQSLKPGLALDADLIQDKRAIWEWMLEPVLSVARR